jgi:gamma-glutamyltranspeptidase/glutathione hydrolase
MNKIVCLAISVAMFFSQNTHAAVLPVAAKNSMVVTEQYLASQVGADILRAGGNAVDAAVAIGYALAVVNPCCGNIGGGGFMTLHLTGNRDIFLNFRERAPLLAKTQMYQDQNHQVIPDKSTFGYLAVATPGTVLGLDTALTKYGTMTRQQVIAPAIKLAQQGFILTAGDIRLLDEHAEGFKKTANVAKIFLNNGKPFQVGDKLIQTDLANTLKLISQQGTKAFYHGKIAQKIVTASQQNGGILSLRDFTEYTVEVMEPLHCSYRGYTIISAPPPSSGGVSLCEMLNIIENYPLGDKPFHSVENAHYLIETMRNAFADRNNQLGDPDFVTNPITTLTAKSYAKEISDKIKKLPGAAAAPTNAVLEKEGVNTTHYSVVDKFGNAVSVTYTLNSFFGAGVIAGNTGFFLNNEMDDFSAKPGVPNQFGLVEGDKNKIEPGKRPLSSMTPTIITKDNHTVMVVGSPGGPRIITATLEAILNVLDHRMNLQAAVDAPRFHQQWLPLAVDVEQDAFTPEVARELGIMGYTFTVKKWGAVEAIYIDPVTKTIYGANDNRRSAGRAIGN